MIHAVDWDDTLVDAKTQAWQDGALAVLQRWLIAGDKVIVHSCRANWPEGRQQIVAALKAARLDHPHVSVEGKPQADDYIDNLAVRHTGDWAETEQNAVSGSSAKPEPMFTRHVAAFADLAPVRAKPRPTFATRS